MRDISAWRGGRDRVGNTPTPQCDLLPKNCSNRMAPIKFAHVVQPCFSRFLRCVEQSSALHAVGAAVHAAPACGMGMTHPSAGRINPQARRSLPPHFCANHRSPGAQPARWGVSTIDGRALLSKECIVEVLTLERTLTELDHVRLLNLLRREAPLGGSPAPLRTIENVLDACALVPHARWHLTS